MKDGNIIQSGSYQKLLTAGTAFEQLVNAHRDVMKIVGGSKCQGETKKIDAIDHKDSCADHKEEENPVGNSEKGRPGKQLMEGE